jgi:hypothetical protein
VWQADVEAVRAACVARQAEHQKICWAIRIGYDAMEWLLNHPEDVPIDSEGRWDHLLEYPWAFRILMDTACGQMGTTEMQTRAFEVMGWAYIYLMQRIEQEHTASLVGLVRAPRFPSPPDVDESGRPVLDERCSTKRRSWRTVMSCRRTSRQARSGEGKGRRRTTAIGASPSLPTGTPIRTRRRGSCHGVTARARHSRLLTGQRIGRNRQV